MRTFIRWYDEVGELEDSVILKDEDATVEAIALAAIEMLSARMCFRPGDMIEVTEGE